FLCTGCQTTPDKETVKQKNNGQAEKIIEDSESGTILSNYSVPSVISDNFKSDTNKLTVNIDADVIIPDVDMILVVVAERAEFSQERAAQIMDGLFESNSICRKCLTS
ncbi:MAG: DUF6034 family protein, partial [Christensenella sp.]